MSNANLNKLILNLDSSQRISGTPSSFTINPNLSGFPAAKSVQVLSVELVNSFYNVRGDSSNFKLRLVKIVNNTNLLTDPPLTFLISINIPSKNYNATSLANQIKSQVDSFCSTNGILNTTTVQPFTFNIDPDTYKFSIQLNQSLTDWGFILPYSTLAVNILGFTGLKQDSEYLNINDTNNTLYGIRLSTNIDNTVNPPEPQRGRIWGSVSVNSQNNRVKGSILRKSDQQVFAFDFNLTPNAYGISTLVTEINSKLATFETANSLPSTMRGTIRNKRMWIENSDNANKPFRILFDQDNTPFLAFFEQWDGSSAQTINPYIRTWLDFHYSNVYVEVVKQAGITIPSGYYTNTSLFERFTPILNYIFDNGNVLYDLNNKTLTSVNALPILFDTSASKAASLFGLPTVSALDVRIGANNTLPTGVSVQMTNVVPNVPVIPIWATLISPSVVNLRGADTIYIHSNVQQSLTADGYGTPSRCILKLPASSPLSYTIQWQNYDIDMFRFPASNTDLLTFELRDKTGKLLENQDLDWSISLCLFFDS